jgi:hypothetical protein
VIRAEQQASENKFVVRGTVRDRFQQPLPDVRVSVFDQDLRTRQLLGSTHTGKDGRYEVVYALRDFASTDKAAADIVVRFGPESSPFGESPVHYNAPPVLVVDFAVTSTAEAGPSEYERLVAAITPYIGSVAIADLEEGAQHRDISFLENKAVVSREKLEQLVIATRLQREGLAATVFYAILGHGAGSPLSRTTSRPGLTDLATATTAALAAITRSELDTLMSAVTRAIDDNSIPSGTTKHLAEIRRNLGSLLERAHREHPMPAAANPLRIDAPEMQAGQVAAFTSLLEANSKTAVWAPLAGDASFEAQKQRLREALLPISRLTAEHSVLTDALIKAQGIKSEADVPKLARLTKAQWSDVLRKQQIDPPPQIPGTGDRARESYAAHLEEVFTEAYPTQAFAARLTTDRKSRIPHAARLADLLAAAPDLDLARLRVSTAFADEPAEVQSAARRAQRVFKVAPRYETTNQLIGDGFDSATKIARVGQARFVDRYRATLGEANATSIYRKAKQAHAQALALVGNLKSMTEAARLEVFPAYDTILKDSLTAEIPDLDQLFGHHDLCECSECESVYGAAAYLSDLLHFLANRVTAIECAPGEHASVERALLRRRPDLGDLDLDCGNTNTVVPYIDIVNEILEDVIAPPAVTLSASLLSQLAKGPLSSTLQAATNAQLLAAGQINVAPLLTTNATISDKYTSERLRDDDTCVDETHWIIRDEHGVFKATDRGAAGIDVVLLHETLLQADEIGANPEYLNINAYHSLAQAKRPFSLPFDLFGAEAALYLDKLGTTKRDLIDAFAPLHDTSGPPSAAELDAAYAYLAVQQAERDLIFRQDLGGQATYWGSLAASSTPRLDLFMAATELSYEQMLVLIELRTIAGSRTLVIENDDLTCDTQKKHVRDVDAATFDIIHRFLRLWKKTPFSLEEADEVVQVLGAGAIGPNLAWQLEPFLDLAKLWSLSPVQLSAFFGPLQTAGEAPLYDSLFQNPAISNPLDPDFSVAKVTSSPVAITSRHAGLIAGALGLASSDLDTLIALTDKQLSLPNLSRFYRHAQLASALDLSIDDLLTFLDLVGVSPFTDPVTTWQFITRWRALISSQLSISDLDYLLRHHNSADQSLISSDDVITELLSGLQDSLLQIEAATAVQVDPKGQLLRKWLSDPLLSWSPKLVDNVLQLLGTQDDAEFQARVDNNHEFLLNLRIQYAQASVSTDLSALAPGLDIPGSIPTSFAGQLSYDAPTRRLVLLGVMSAADQTMLKGLPAADAAFKQAVDRLFAAQTTSSATSNVFFANVAAIDATLRPILSASIGDRYKLFLAAISPVYAALRQREQVEKTLDSWFKNSRDVTRALLASRPAIYTDLTAPAFIHKASTLDATNYTSLYTWYQRLAKISFLTAKLKLTADDLGWLLAHGAAIQALDLWSLPITSVVGAVTTFKGFAVIVELLKLVQRFPPVDLVTTTATTKVSVYTLLDDALGGSQPDFETHALRLTGWDAAQLTALLDTPNVLGVTSAGDLADVSLLRRIARCFDLMAQLGASVADCVAWSQPQLQWDDSRKIKQALQAKSERSQWLAITTTLQNKLREQRRDALIAYLLATGFHGYTTADELYSHFLIDVQMCSCLPTSRIVQATNTVQQFVERCFLHIEKNITVDTEADPDWAQWTWMKNFRVWQANRKVFLYPENWIEPELLPNEIKSSFLKDLESDLLQNDVTRDNVESAFLKYLEQLDGVSRLEVKAMWYDDAKRTLHVVSRTYGGDPKLYYYRTFVEGRRWTPWQRIDQDIASDHIVLTVFNHRVYLFWAMFTEKAREITSSLKIPTAGSTSFDPDRPEKYWQIQLAFSELKNGKWTPKKISNNDPSGILEYNQYWDTSQHKYLPEAKDFVFTPLDLPQIDIRSLFNEKGEPKDKDSWLERLLELIRDALDTNGDLRINAYRQYTYDGSPPQFGYFGTFDLDPCKGYPVVTHDYVGLRAQLFDRSQLVNMLDTEMAGGTVDSLAVNAGAILGATPGTFANLIPLQMGILDRLLEAIYELTYPQTHGDGRLPVTVGTFMPFFYQDRSYTYYVQPELTDDGDFEFTYQDLVDLILAFLEGNTNRVTEILATFPRGRRLRYADHFYNFYHPLVCSFMRTLFDKGIDALMARKTQLAGDVIFDASPHFDFNATLHPTAAVYSGAPVTYAGPSGSVVDSNPGYPKGDVDFDPKGGYSEYNWELFFHAPLMIAQRLSQNQQFEEADRWFKFIFNPTDSSTYPAPDKFWVTKPFFENVNDKYTKQNIDAIMLGIDSGQKQLIDDVTDWRNNPFQPHYIAQYRTVAYQKTTVMKYLDHLIAWGDSLYRQGTMESIAEATQLYVLASQILGPEPKLILPSFERPVDNYQQLETKIDAFSNALVEIENLLPQQTITGHDGTVGEGLPSLQTLYFCIPPNDKLLGYWQTVGTRLYNIRHCLTIDGVFAPPALFAPPIDPGLLVRAAAAGLDLGSVLGDLNAPLPVYRFSTMMQKALDLGNEVKTLGSSLLNAMQQRDAEELALLRSKNGVKLLQAALEVKKLQVTEAEHSLAALEAQQALVQVRIDHYNSLINTGLNSWELASLSLSSTAIAGESAAVIVEYLGNVMALIPDFNLGASGFGGSPHVAAKFGGQQLGEAMRAMAGAIRGTAGVMHSMANVSSTVATFERRKEEWQLQLDLAKAELTQVQKQTLAATIRKAIADKEVANQGLQIENAQSEDELMHNKFTNNELYSWMVGQLSTIYSQSYQLAYALAKQAEQTFRYELGDPSTSFVNFGYWDSQKKGLLAGEQLMFDLRRMDGAYRDQNARELELTKHVSLAQLDPSALMQLKTNKECWINLPEELFDMDHPGHYMRRIKSVALTIPCVAGPYTTVSTSLTMTRNSLRVTNAAGDPTKYPRKLVAGVPADDPRFRDAVGAIQTIATSSTQNDAGMFETNLRDERYLPFEGAGAISQWHLTLPAPRPQFDYATISDVILHVRYTARDGGEQLRSDATTSLATKINTMLVSLKDTGLMRVFSVKNEMSTEWTAFLNPAGASADQILELRLTADRFPYLASLATIKISKIELIADTTLSAINGIQVTPTPLNTPPLNLTADAYYGTMKRLVLDYGGSKKPPGTWTLRNPVANPRLTRDQLSDLVVLVHYEIS